MKTRLGYSTRLLLASTLLITAPFATQAASYSNGSATASLNVTLTINAGCIISANSLAFPASGVIASALTGSSTLSVTCTNSTPYNVGLNEGTGSGATVANRYMTLISGSPTVGYSLYQDSGYSTVWGNTQGTNTVGGIGTGSAQTLTYYGKVPVQTTPVPGNYSDTITATVYY
jgi:spore coat protein U-like protein